MIQDQPVNQSPATSQEGPPSILTDPAHTFTDIQAQEKLKKHSGMYDPNRVNQWARSCQPGASPQPERMHPGRTLPKAGEGRGGGGIPNILHMLHNNTQWSQNKMTSFTIFMAFCLLFYTIYNHLISFFSTREEKKMLMYNNYYFKPSKYCLIYFIVNTFVYSFFF